MNEPIKWKAEIEFEGAEEQLAHLAETLQELPVAVNVPGWPKPRPFPGIVPIEAVLGKEFLARFAVRERTLNIRPGLINGGHPGPHIHLDGKVVVLEREQFAELVGEVARQLAVQLATSKSDYIEVAAPIARLHSALEVRGRVEL